MNSIKITASADSAVIDIEGNIGTPEEWQFEQNDNRVATYSKLRTQLEQLSSLNYNQIVVNIRSIGGSVADALLIYDALSSLKAKITTRCYGYVASAATVIAQAADEGCREISSNALYLIHRSGCAVEGNATQLREQIDLLERTDERLAEIYATRSGRNREEFTVLMSENSGKGRWLSPEEALEMGLVDAVVEPSPIDRKTKKLMNQVRGEVTVTEHIRRCWHTLAEFLGVADTPTEGLPNSSAETEQPLPVAQEIHNPLTSTPTQPQPKQTRIDAIREGQAEAKPTVTERVEDPSPDGEMRQSANQRAYSDDAKIFKSL